MTKTNIIILLIVLVIVLVALLVILYKTFGEKLDHIMDKLNDSENDILDKLKKKYDLTKKLIEYTESKYKVESKIFDETSKITIENLNSFKDEKKLNKCYKEIIQIKEDNSKVKETKAFKELLNEYDENEISIISLRTFHNKYTLEYNNMIHKFPYNIISKIKRYKLISLIDGKELDNNFNNDLEV